MKSLALLLLGCAVLGAEAPRPLITQRIDDTQLVTLQGNLHPMARASHDLGRVPADFPLVHLRLVLKRAPEQERAVLDLIDRLHDRTATAFHHWLTPPEVGQFGAAREDVEAVSAWLARHGLRVDQIYPSRTMIEFSGTAARVADAFHTEIHQFEVDGEVHWANASDPRIPAVLAPAIAGIARLNNFRPHAAYRRSNLRPDATLSLNGNNYYLIAAYDFATIYNLTPLWNAGVTGQGQTVALVEDSNINPADVAAFRAGLGLPAFGPAQFQAICAPQSNCATTADEAEGAIDAEWAGAVAPGTTILYVAADTVEDAASYVVNNNLAPIVSISFSQCESELGSGGNAFWAGLWQTAVLQGMTVATAAGDSGGAACDGGAGAPYASVGLSVNGIASTPDSVAIGGTDFSDTFAGTNSTYWSASNSSNLASALSYVPEMTWNNSCASGVLTGFLGFPPGEEACEVLLWFFGTNPLNPLNIVAGSGGVSASYTKPTWQANVAGIVNDGMRDLPDVSLFASDNAWSHAYIYCMSDPAQNGSPCDYTNPGDTVNNSGGGTSFATAAFAGIMALVGQQTGSAQGNANYVLYGLAGNEYGTNASPNTQALGACNAGQGNQASSTCLFYDITLGDTAVPCQTGSPNCYTVTAGDAQGVLSTSGTSLAAAFQAGAGWDFATGLGSINVANLVQGWNTSGASYVISGQVSQSSGPFAGVKVSLSGAKTAEVLTNSSGEFRFVVPGGQGYAVTPSYNGYAFDPPSTSFKSLGANETANFTGIGTNPVASVSPGSLTFGNQNAGIPSPTQSVVLTNTGNGPLTLSTLSIAGANAADFTQTNTCGSLPAQIAAGGTCTIRVSFVPSLAGAETAALTLHDNSHGRTGKQTVGLSGTGVISLNITPATLAFGYAGVNVESPPQSVEITNTSAVTVSLSNMAVSGAEAADFHSTSHCGVSLAPGGKCTVTLVFRPQAVGGRSATLSVTDSATGSPQTVALKGAGTNRPVIAVSPGSLHFPVTSVGTTSAALTVTVTNDGHGQLSIVGASATTGFAVTNGCSQPLSSRASCTIQVTFTPTQTGEHSGNLRITGNGIVQTQEIRLTGTGR